MRGAKGDDSPYLGWTSFLMRSPSGGGGGILPTFVGERVYKKSLVPEKEPFKTSGSFLMLNNRHG